MPARRTATDFAALKRILDDTDRIVAEGGNIIDSGQAFHLVLADASQNSVLVRVLHVFYCLTLSRRRTLLLIRNAVHVRRRIIARSSQPWSGAMRVLAWR